MDTQIEQHIEIDTETQHKAKEYARKRRRLSLVNMAIGAAGVIILLATNLNSWLRSLLQPLGWQSDLFKGLVLGLVLESLAIELVYALLAFQPNSWWLWTAIVMLFFSVVM